MSDWPPEIVAALPERLDPDLEVLAGDWTVSVDIDADALCVVDEDGATHYLDASAGAVIQLSHSVTLAPLGWLRGLLGLADRTASLVLELRQPGIPDLHLRADVATGNRQILASLPHLEATDAPELELESLLQLIGWVRRLGIRPAHIGAGDAVASEPPAPDVEAAPDVEPSPDPPWRERLRPHQEVIGAATAIPASLLAPLWLGDARLAAGSVPLTVAAVLAALLLGATRVGLTRADGAKRAGGLWAVVGTVSAATMLFTSVPLTPGFIAFALCILAAVHGVLVGVTWGLFDDGSLGAAAYGGGIGLGAGVFTGCALAIVTQWVIAGLFDPGPPLAIAALTCVAVASTFVGMQMRSLRI